MILKTKYIKTNKGEFITFLETIKHKDMVNGFTIVSAGFVYFNGKQFICYGESNSLNLKSDPEDTYLINKSFNIEID